MCYFDFMSEVGLRELRQNASELVRRAEAGERLTITMAGRPVAVLCPLAPVTWGHWDDLASALSEPVDPDWEADLARFDGTVTDPWQPR
jgi:prevent-host-death family protein